MAVEHSPRRLPDSELMVMQAVWSCDAPASRGEIEEKLPEGHPMALTTLLTLLSRLAEKGFLQIEKVGRASRYTPLVTRETYLAGQSRRFLDQLCGGSLPVFAQALCDGGLTEGELAQLRELLDRREL